MQKRSWLSLHSKPAFFSWLILALIVALPGCSQAPTLAAVEPVTIRFTYLRYAAEYEPLAEEFHRLHPQITVELHPMPVVSTNAGANLQAEVPKSDAMRFGNNMVSPELAQQFLTLDSRIASARDFPTASLFPSVLNALKVGGKQVGLPAGLNPYVFFYSPKKFKAAGVEPPRPDWDLDEFIRTAKAVQNTDETLAGTDWYTVGFCTHPAFNDTYLFTTVFGGGMFDDITTLSHPTLNRKENIEALNWYAGLRKDAGVAPSDMSPVDVARLVTGSNCGLWGDLLDRGLYIGFGPGDAVPLPVPSRAGHITFAALDGYFIPTAA